MEDSKEKLEKNKSREELLDEYFSNKLIEENFEKNKKIKALMIYCILWIFNILLFIGNELIFNFKMRMIAEKSPFLKNIFRFSSIYSNIQVIFFAIVTFGTIKIRKYYPKLAIIIMCFIIIPEIILYGFAIWFAKGMSTLSSIG